MFGPAFRDDQEHLGIGIATGHGMIGGMIGGILPNKYLEAIKRHQFSASRGCCGGVNPFLSSNFVEGASIHIQRSRVPFDSVPKPSLLLLKDENSQQAIRVHAWHLSTNEASVAVWRNVLRIHRWSAKDEGNEDSTSRREVSEQSLPYDLMRIVLYDTLLNHGLPILIATDMQS
ncbi:hypothetical protein K438DRAFT_1761363 [Mycena galopus ATCC 62051]|nr:hypothetical protein K438DRAFT_1761363 [Mycena galopus ATCC 62051]